MPVRPLPDDRQDISFAADGGLTRAEAEDRRARFGPNRIVPEGPAGWLGLARKTARDPMIWFLALTSILFLASGQRLEGLLLAVAVVPLVGMDFWLHRRTQASTSGLAGRLAVRATVVRDGVAVELSAVDLVPGDLVEVSRGAYFPADGLLVAADGVQVDESALTGEAWPIAKTPLIEPPSRPVDMAHWGFAGTRLLTGSALLRLVYTGPETLYGEIARSAVRAGVERTELQRQVSRLVGAMLVLAIAFCIVLAAVRLWQGFGLLDALVSAATLAIAALPEEFPVVFTMFLGVGVFRLARQNALVRRAIAVENIGRVTCICADKTGTLTEGRLVLASRHPAHGRTPDDLMALAADASRTDSGDPLDSVILAAGKRPEQARAATFPFTEDRRRETAIIDRAGELLAVVKGSPETVLGICTGDAADAERWRRLVADEAGLGRKVIAVASRRATQADCRNEPGAGFAMAGLLGFEDPVRPGVREAIAECRAAGIRVIMVTGDHPATATAIARRIGLGQITPRVALADGLAGEAGLIAEVDVVARATPGQKLGLVQGLRAAGEVVAVTGDGVNDVPALQAADIGIAMGERGTQGARDVSAIVLLDDNFQTIVRAIAEGRQLFRNLQLAFAYLLMVHIPLVISAAIAPLAGWPLLFLPIHIVWLELIIHPTALLVFQETAEPGKLGRAPRGAAGRLFDARSRRLIGLSGALQSLFVLAAYGAIIGAGEAPEIARAVGIGMIIATSAGASAALSRLGSRMSWWLFLASVSTFVLFSSLGGLASLVGLRPMGIAGWALVAGAGGVAWLFGLALRKPAARRAGPING
jgi:Ca2+-transporting ATPase